MFVKEQWLLNKKIIASSFSHTTTIEISDNTQKKLLHRICVHSFAIAVFSIADVSK